MQRLYGQDTRTAQGFILAGNLTEAGLTATGAGKLGGATVKTAKKAVVEQAEKKAAQEAAENARKAKQAEINFGKDAEMVGQPEITTGSHSAGKANNSQSVATTPPVTSNGAANIATGAKLNLDLKTTQAANEVVESLRTTGQLPNYYITKQQAITNGWSGGKALNNTNPGKAIGGNLFHNNENILPNAAGRVWYEADIGVDYSRSRKNQSSRILYSNDGLLYVTSDHYQSAPLFIGKWK